MVGTGRPRQPGRRAPVSGVIQFWQAHAGELLQLVRQHLVLVIVSTVIATALGLPAGILAARRPAIGRPLLLLANIAQTIPSLALFGFLLPLPFIGGIGPRTALVTLTLYALLPIVRTTVAGLRSLDHAVTEAGVAMGMTPRQLLFMVELPLALPSIVAGIRVAAVVGVGTATIAAAIGAGGLGEYIFRGLSMVDTTMILAGAIPAAVLALLVDGLLAGVERLLGTRRPRPARSPPVPSPLPRWLSSSSGLPSRSGAAISSPSARRISRSRSSWQRSWRRRSRPKARSSTAS